MIKKDCFAYRNKKGVEGCSALNELFCKNAGCKFYKNLKEINIQQIEYDIKKYSNK